MLPACRSGTCTDVKDDASVAGQKQFLGGCDIRERMSGPKLRSIDNFNASVAAGGSEGAPVLERLRGVLVELGIENGDYDSDGRDVDEAAKILGGKLKNALKAIAVEQLRIK